MKHIVCSAFLLIIALLAAPQDTFAQTTPKTDASGPEEVARGFYAFYLGELNKDNWSPLKKRREALKYLTPEFHKLAPRLAEKWMVDTIICAQDWDPNWAKSFTVGRAAVRGSKATTVVRLPPFGGSGPAIEIKLTLVRRAGQWRISTTDCVN